MKISGKSRRARLSFCDAVLASGSKTEIGEFYFIISKGASTALPEKAVEGYPFRAAAAITLVAGDIVYKMDNDLFCKTEASCELSQGTVDSGDDCDPGAQTLDGIITASGTLTGFLVFDDKTQQFIDITQKILDLFFVKISDDGRGDLEVTMPSAKRIFLSMCLNDDAPAGSIENWFIIPIIIPSLSLPGGNTEIQSASASWSKGEGPIVRYEVPRAA